MKLLVERLTEEEGVLLKGVHEHRLYYQKVAEPLGMSSRPTGPRIAFCKICRERIGPRTGGPEGFKCISALALKQHGLCGCSLLLMHLLYKSLYMI